MISVRGKDCFRTIRLLAAFHVVWVHAFSLLGGVNENVIGNLLRFFPGVPVFFMLSGYFIWESINRSPSFCKYCEKRFWRIYPELWVAVLIELIAIIFLFKGEIDWPQFALFAIGQATIVPFWTPEFLRGYGCGTPNGVLWTIFALVQFYFIAYPLYHAFHGKKMVQWLGALCGLVAVSAIFRCAQQYMPTAFSKIFAISCVPYLWIFALGSFMSEYRNLIVPALVKYWYIPVILRGVTLFVDILSIPVFNYGFFSTIVSAAAVVAIGYRFPALDIKKDISYGIYIYHMTVMNAMLVLGLVGKGWIDYIVLITITCILSYLSTIIIGDYCMKKKERFALVPVA